MLIDCHMHTPFCGHAAGLPIEYVMVAVENGIDLLTFTCHVPMQAPSFGQQGIRMRRDEVDAYVKLVRKTAEAAKPLGVEVLCGIEAEIHPDEEQMEWMDEVLEENDFDFVLGSLHAQCVSYLDWLREYRMVEDATRIDSYFRHLKDGVQSGRYDSIAHPDVIRTYGVVSSFDPAAHEEVIRDFLAAAVEEDICIEVNTSGLTKGAFEVHPDPVILRWACEQGVKLTLGSDAHSPDAVGRHYDTVLPLLRETGFEVVHFHRGRRREAVLIEDPA